LAGDLGLAHADGEQLSGAQPAGLQPLTFLFVPQGGEGQLACPDPHPAEQPHSNSATTGQANAQDP
jgi:hypothetical protein